MAVRKLLLFLSFFILAKTTFTQPSDQLPRSLPEAQGISSTDISRFLEAAKKSKTEFHSFMLLRHGKVIAEGWWNPYKSDLKHSLYSCSKSFTATAIGFAIQEKKLALTDKVISFFPEFLPDTVSPFLSELTVRDVLMMSDGQDPDPSFSVVSKDSNWIKGFLATPIKNEPGTTFLYNSLGTYILSAIISKVTGQKTVDYLKPRLFDPLGIKGMDWETDTRGINAGGWGLRLKTEDMARFAELFLQKGKWNGQQILPESWVAEASSMKIMQDPDAPASKKDSSDWLQGYCYQMWRCRHNCYRGDGAYGQYMIVMPDQDAVLAITAETADMQEEINLVWDYLLPAFKQDRLPANRAAAQKLEKQIQSLALPVLPAKAEPIENNINGKTYSLEPNMVGIKQLIFHFQNNQSAVTVISGQASYPLQFGLGTWLISETDMAGPSLLAGAIENRSMLFPGKVAGMYSWKDAQTLVLVLRYIESPHTLTLICHFDGKNCTIEAARSLDFGKRVISLKGQSN